MATIKILLILLLSIIILPLAMIIYAIMATLNLDFGTIGETDY